MLILQFLVTTVSLSGQASLELGRRYTVKDGLSHNLCWVIREDSRGFLWMGTSEGLSRFDGQTFRTYYHYRNDFQSLPNDLVWDILEYTPGRLLLATNSGVGILNTVTSQFENDRMVLPELRAGSGAVVTKLNVDPEGNIWIVHGGEIDVFDPSLAFCHRLTDQEWAQSIRGVTMYLEDWEFDGRGRIWLPSDTSGIIVIDPVRQQIQHARNNPDDYPWFKHKLIRTIQLEGDSILWVSQWDEGLYKYDLVHGRLLQQVFPGSNTSVPELRVMDNGHMLLGKVDGRLLELDPRTCKYTQVHRPGFPSDQSVVDGVVSIFRARNGDYWVGTTNGFWQLRRAARTHILDVSVETGGYRLRSDYRARSGRFYSLLWDGRMIEIDSALEERRTFRIPGACFENDVYHLAEDEKGRIWIGTEEGLFAFDPGSARFYQPNGFPPEVASGKVRALHVDSEHRLWVATADPVQVFRLEPDEGEASGIGESCLSSVVAFGAYNYVWKIEEDLNGSVWLLPGYGGGLIRIDRESLQCESFPRSGNSRDRLMEGTIYGLFPARDSSIWIFRQTSEGFIRYEPSTDSLAFYTREDGLLSNNLYDVCQADNKTVWLSSSRGIMRFDLARRMVTGSFEPDFDPGITEYSVSMDTARQQLVLSGSGKVIFLDPEAVVSDEPPPAPFLDGFIVNGQALYVNGSAAPVALKSRQRFIRIGFNAISHSLDGSVLFSYALSDGEENWSAPGTGREAEYSFLQPGHYTFRVRTMSPTGRWSDPVELVRFSIARPLWERTWLRLLLGVLAGILLYGFIRWRFRTLRQNASLKLEMTELEMKTLQAQMNPHFIFNCLNSIDALIHSNEKHLATQFLNKFARLIRNVLDSSRNNVTPFSKDVETLRLYVELEQFRHDSRFEVEWDVDPQLLRGDFQLPPLIIQPFVENAILHGLGPRQEPGGMLRIGISQVGDHVRYLVDDNGVGRMAQPDSVGSDRESHGIRMTLDRIRLFNREDKPSVTITDRVEDGRPAGTRVEVILHLR